MRVILEICYEWRGSWNENPEGKTRREKQDYPLVSSVRVRVDISVHEFDWSTIRSGVEIKQ